MLLLLAGGMVTHNAQGQNQGVAAEPLGDSFVFFVDRINPDVLKVEVIDVVKDPKGSDNRVAKLTPGGFHIGGSSSQMETVRAPRAT